MQIEHNLLIPTVCLINSNVNNNAHRTLQFSGEPRVINNYFSRNVFVLSASSCIQCTIHFVLARYYCNTSIHESFRVSEEDGIINYGSYGCRLIKYRYRNIVISRALLKNQGEKDTILFNSAATN